MRLAAILISLGFAMISTAWAKPCPESWVDQPPFHLIEVTQNQVDQVRLGSQDLQVVGPGTKILTESFGENGRVAKGSLVRVLKRDEPGQRVEVEIMQSSLSEQVAGLFPGMAASKSKAWVPAGSVREPRADDVIRLPGKKYGLKLSVKDGRFRARVCPGGKVEYVFSAVGKRAAEAVVCLAPEDCRALLPVCSMGIEGILRMTEFAERLEDQFGEVSLDTLELNQWGLARLPLAVTGSSPGIEGSTADGGMVHYLGTDPAGSDAWGDPDVICELMTIQQEWAKICKATPKSRCTLQIGDLAFVTPGHLKDSKKDPLGHQMHETGECVDMRLFRKDGLLQGTTLPQDESIYDRELMREFITLITKHGAGPVYLSDPQIAKSGEVCNLNDPWKDAGRGVLSCDGHSNHIHFCLPKAAIVGCK